MMNESGLNLDNESQDFNWSTLNKIDHEEFVSDKHEDIGKTCYKLAKMHYDKSDLILAEKYFKKSLELSNMPQDVFTIFKMLGFLVRIHSEKEENGLAVEYVKQSEELVENLTTILGSLNAEYFYNLGIVKNYKGEFEEARKNFELAFQKSKEENVPGVLAKTLLALATNYFGTQDYQKALDYLEQLNQLLVIIDKSYLRGSMYMFAGKIYMETEDYEKALQSFDKAMVCLKDKKSWNLYGYVQLGRGIIYKRKGQYDKALIYFKLGLESSDEKSFKRLSRLLSTEIQDVNDNSIDLYLDRINRKVIEKNLGTIDFKHRFVLLEILFLLAQNTGEYYDKEQLAKSIWKDEYNPLIHDKLIYTSVSRLRKLIEPKNAQGDKRKYIIRGKDGYTFNPRVKIRFHIEQVKVQQDNTIANIELSSPV
jgi:tetratricopeptide (TPR) repeat protein